MYVGRTWRGELGRITSGEWKVLAAVLLVGFAVRLFRLGQPDSIIFDEVYFGKFAGKYIKTRYYVDVHPPLAKLLITLAIVIRPTILLAIPLQINSYLDPLNQKRLHEGEIETHVVPCGCPVTTGIPFASKLRHI